MAVGTRRRGAKGAVLARFGAVAARADAPMVGVLLLEDDPDRQFRLARLLSAAGHRVVGASSGSGALALMSQWAVDLVIVSEQLSSATGASIARRLRAAHPHVPVVLLTDRPAHQRRKRDLLRGATTEVADPRNVDEVHALMASVLRPPPVDAA